MDVDSATHGFGLFGEDFGYPGGGLCLSVFLAVQREGRLLAGRMAADHEETWIQRWAPNVAFYEGQRHEELFGGWRFPATYLQVGESPEQAARRVWSEQLGFADEPRLGQVRVSSTSQPSRRTPEHEHWDVVFAYALEGPAVSQPPQHWAELAYHDADELGAEGSVMMHGSLVSWLASLTEP